jgi:hypothetical protein
MSERNKRKASESELEESGESQEKKARDPEPEPMVCVGSSPRGSKWAHREGYENVDVTSRSKTGKAVSPLYVLVQVAKIDGRWLLREEVADEKAWQEAEKKEIPFEHAYQGIKAMKALGHWDTKTQQPTAKYWADRETIFFDKGKDGSKPGKGNRRPKMVDKLITKHRRQCDQCKAIKKRRAENKAAKKAGKKSLPHLHKCTDLPKPEGLWFNGKLHDYVSGRLEMYWPVYTRCILEVPFFQETKKQVASGVKKMVQDGDGPPLARFPHGRGVCECMLFDAAHDTSAPMGHGYVFAAALLGLGRPVV